MPLFVCAMSNYGNKRTKTIKLDLGSMKSTFFGKLIDPVDIGIVDAAMNKCWLRRYYFKADGFRIRNLLKNPPTY